ncbi:MAG: CDP-diacylglycerol--serine O-phosphatidyltransferase [Deltaproteobacteria bacterium]|nr:CDP-diacylglycerol--serine O-phosphatidyltransferase [Deltaproteobacteria bacterium]
MLRGFSLPDLITLANGMLGMGTVIAIMRFLVTGERYSLHMAYIFLPLALVADFADGRIARWRHKASLLGQELDSLADLISFGVAPAAVAFACGMQGTWDALILIYFVCCGISRLARYNITASTLSDDKGKVRYFEGTPIPTSLVLVAVLAVLTHLDRIGPALPFGAFDLGPWTLHPLVLMYLVSGTLMVSKTLRIPKP